MTSRFVVAALLCLVVAGQSFGQGKNETKEKGQQATPEMQEMMKKWQEVMTPGEPHKMLQQMAGTWDVVTKNWMGGPGTEPSVTQGTAEMKMLLGGRYLQQDVAGEMMGMPFSGMGLTGYDNFKKKYVSFWIDNMGTGMYTMEGEMDKDGKSCTYWGLMDDPMTGEKDKKVKYVLTMDGPDKQLFRIYDVSAFGEKDPTMEMTYTRKK
jgi:hypothetical protein